MTNNLANEKIRIYIYDFGSEPNAGSHAALEFGGQVIDFGPNGFADNQDNDQHECRVYEIDPQRINVNPERLVQAIQQRKQQLNGSDYFYFGQNCAEQVCAVLRQAGARDLPDETGLHIPTPTMTGMADVISDKIDIPVIGGIVGSAVSGAAQAAKTITGQETLEEYCQQQGHLAETRKSSTEFYRIQSQFNTYMDILKDPEAYKTEMRRRCDLELRGEEPYSSAQERAQRLAEKAQERARYSEMLESQRSILPPAEFNRLKSQYDAYFNRASVPSAAEQARIRARYNNLIAQANLPPQQIEERAVNLFLQSGSDRLLQDRLISLAQEKNPQLLAKYIAQANRMMQNLPVGRDNTRMINVNNRTGNSPIMSRNGDRGRYS